MTGPLPSTALRFAVCINELTPTTSKMPSWLVLLTRSPRFGAATLASGIFAPPGRVARSVFLGVRIVKTLRHSIFAPFCQPGLVCLSPRSPPPAVKAGTRQGCDGKGGPCYPVQHCRPGVFSCLRQPNRACCSEQKPILSARDCIFGCNGFSASGQPPSRVRSRLQGIGGDWGHEWISASAIKYLGKSTKRLCFGSKALQASMMRRGA